MIFHLFTLLFVALKLLGAIDWPWLAVLAPSIAAFALAYMILLIGLFVATRR
jgi:hypothetical protein